MFVAVLEAVAVGTLVRRRLGIALASAGFWIAAGVPILYGWSAGVLQADSGEATAGALQQALNGVAQAVLVQILAAWPLARTWLRRQHDAPMPLRAQVFDSVIPLAVCPVIVLGLVLGRVVASGEEQDTAASWSSAPPSSAAVSTSTCAPTTWRRRRWRCASAPRR